MEVYMCDNPTNEDFIAVGKAMWDAVQAFKAAEITDDMPRDVAIDSFITVFQKQKRANEDQAATISVLEEFIKVRDRQILSLTKENERLENEANKEGGRHEVTRIEDCVGVGTAGIYQP